MRRRITRILPPRAPKCAACEPRGRVWRNPAVASAARCSDPTPGALPCPTNPTVVRGAPSRSVGPASAPPTHRRCSPPSAGPPVHRSGLVARAGGPLGTMRNSSSSGANGSASPRVASAATAAWRGGAAREANHAAVVPGPPYVMFFVFPKKLHFPKVIFQKTCLVADACAPARPCRSIRHGQCRALGVQDVGGHLLRAPMRSGPCGLCLPHPLVPGLAGMDGRAETRHAP